MKQERLDHIATLLRAHPRLSAAELAARCGVSIRTIQRDVDELSRRGVPIYAEHGRTGGYSLLPGYRPPTTDLTDAETLALFLPGGDHPAGALGLHRHRKTAMSKLSALLDADRSRRATLLQERVLVVPEGWREPVPPPTHLRPLFAAVTRNRIVDLDYRPRAGAPGVRRCEPLGLVVGGIHWYLLARKAGTSKIRTYRIDRIESVVETGDGFLRDASIDLPRLWEAARTWYREGEAPLVRVRTNVQSLPLVRQVMELACGAVRVVDTDRSESEDVVLEGRMLSSRGTAGLLAGLGSLAEVVHPESVRMELARLGRENLTAYGA